MASTPSNSAFDDPRMLDSTNDQDKSQFSIVCNRKARVSNPNPWWLMRNYLNSNTSSLR